MRRGILRRLRPLRRDESGSTLLLTIAYGVLAFIAAAVGVGIAARHVYVQMLPPEMGATCGPPLSFLRETMGPLEVFRTVLTGTGNCGNIDWTFLGLTMPMWSGVWFVLLALWALVVSLRRVKR